MPFEITMPQLGLTMEQGTVVEWLVEGGDTITVRPMMTLSLVFDHRVIDGTPAARFLDRIAQLIQELRLLLVIG